MAAPYYSSTELFQHVLPRASEEELLGLTRALFGNTAQAKTPERIIEELCSVGGSSVGNILRGRGVPYTELLYDLSRELNIKDIPSRTSITLTGMSIDEMDRRALDEAVNEDVARSWHPRLNSYIFHIEQAIFKKFIMLKYEKLTPEQRRTADGEFARLSGGSGLASIGIAAGAMAAAQAGGFTTYMAMSSAIHAVTLGSVGFGAYAAASTALSYVLGPVGWAALGVVGLYKLNGPNREKCLKATITLAMLRLRP